jgi:hypothetical protein
MPRLLWTSDGRLGQRPRSLPGERGARLRAARFDAWERLAALAHAEEVDAVLVAGDLLDDIQVSAATLRRAAEVLAACAPRPVLVLPGARDPACPGAPWARLAAAAGPHVHVLRERAPWSLGDLTVWPCPLTRLGEGGDPTAWLPPRPTGDGHAHVVLAHGGQTTGGPGPHRVAVPAVLAKGYDVVGLGGAAVLTELDARAWAPGPPEPTRPTPEDAASGAGFALLVDLPLPLDGGPPAVRPVRVGALVWRESAATVRGPADLDALDAWWSSATAQPGLVRLTLRGALAPADRARLDALLARPTEAALDVDDDVATVLDDDALAGLDAPGFLGQALHDLRDAAATSRAAAEAAAALHRTLRAGGAR